MRKKLAMKICAIAMTAAMVGTMAGCGNDSGSQTSGDAGNSSSDTPSSSEEQGGADESSEETPADDGGEEAGGEEAGGQTYDFGGVTVRVNGGIWEHLKDDKKGDAEGIVAWDLASKLEAKYNIKLEYVELQNDDGYSTSDAILATITSGECFADIFTVGDDVMVNLKDYLAEVTDTNALEMGSIYIEPATWAGHTYGFTYDNMGSCYVMAYSREYLKSIGMDVTPTEKFLKGEWSYEDAKAYMTELKTKLPEGTYPIAVHSNHWVSMAPPANGTVSVDSQGGIHLAEDAYVESLEFYTDLLSSGLASPIYGYYKNDDGSVGAYEEDENGGSAMPYGIDGMCTATEAKDHVMTMVEAWQMGDLETNLGGEWGIVPWPWGSQVTCEGDYTTLSENYHVAQSIWTNIAVPKQEYRAEGAKTLNDMDLFLIARDWCDLKSEDGATARHAMWEAEQKGEPYVNLGYSPGTMGNFSTAEDAGLYDWLHSRVVVDWGHCMNTNATVRVNWNGYYVIAIGEDARSSGESWTNSGEQAMKDKGYK